ncbi:hypothetical protein BC937DRAFT_88176, partial [Endogone sp. FLAS-F59071]
GINSPSPHPHNGILLLDNHYPPSYTFHKTKLAMGLFGLFGKRADPNSITSKIKTAVNPKKKDNNAGTVDDIVALVNSNPNGPEEAGKAIFKQLKAVKPEKQILALELLAELGDKSEKFRPQLANETLVNFFYANATESWTDRDFKTKIIEAAQHWQTEFQEDESLAPVAGLYQKISSTTSAKRRSQAL